MVLNGIEVLETGGAGHLVGMENSSQKKRTNFMVKRSCAFCHKYIGYPDASVLTMPSNDVMHILLPSSFDKKQCLVFSSSS